MLEQSIFDDLEDFFDSIPDVVRAELSLLLVALADDPLVDTKDPHDYDRSARELFDARGRLGRFGNLIYALGAFDVYFAADPRERFGSATPRLENTTTQGDNTGPLRGRYADRLAAIDMARGRWQTLRQTSLTPEAIGAALLPRLGSAPAASPHARLATT